MSSRSNQRLALALQQHVAEMFGGAPRRVELRYFMTEGGEPFVESIPDATLAMLADAARREAGAPDERLSPAQLAIIEVVNALDVGESLSGPEVAERAGYRYNGWFSKLLTHLARSDRIAFRKGDGYGRLLP